MNRYKKIVNQYETTIFVGSIVQTCRIKLQIGLEDEAKKYTALLGYNYQSSDWYERSYKIFNKNYKKELKKDLKNEDNLLKFKNYSIKNQ